MIITDKYIYLHFPKTGGTFITNFLRSFYANQLIPSYSNKNLIAKLQSSKPFFLDYKKNEILDDLMYKKGNHNGFFQIPKEHQNKPVFTTFRDPFDFYVSYYETKTWANEKLLNKKEILEIFPDFPKLSFEEFMEFTEYFFSKKLYKLIFKQDPTLKIGLYTILTILMYSSDPFNCINELSKYKKLSSVPTSKLFVNEQLIFLNFLDLNTELYNFLSPFHEEWDLKFIHDLPKANVATEKLNSSNEEYYSEKLMQQIEKIDSLCIRFYKEKFKSNRHV